MIDFSDERYARLLARQLARVPADLDKREGSLIWTALGPESYALEEAYLELDQIQKNGFALTAQGAALDKKVAEAGLARYPASSAVRLGIFSLDIPIGARFSTNNGAESVVFQAAEKLSTGQYKMVSEAVGAVGNRYSGPLLAITFVEGLASAVLADILIPGDDEESDTALLARWREYITSKPFGGNVADYKAAILAMDGIGGVQIYPTWDGAGTVKCSIVGADYLPASKELVRTVQDAIDPPESTGQGYGLAPIGARATICAPEEVYIKVTATVTIVAGYTLEQLLPALRQGIEERLETVRRQWDTPTVPGTVLYSSAVYRAGITASLLSVAGVVNVTGLTLNGVDADVLLQETGQVQQVPMLGEVLLYGD